MTLKELWRVPGVKILFWCALASAVFSVGLFIYSLDRQESQVVGKVIVINDNSLVVENPEGEHVTILITPDTKTAALGPLDQVLPGTLVFASGKRVSTSTISAFGIRRVEDKPLRGNR